MKENKIAFLSLVLVTLLMISCSKDEIKIDNKSKQNAPTINSRLNTEMTDAEYETDIINFITKLDSAEGYDDMNYIEAFEYVESTLIYKYINLDYSKCKNTTEFNSSISISPDEEGMMSMVAIKDAYDAMKGDWSANFHSISDDDKTPIVFRITEITNTTVKFQMLVGHGYIDLSLWGENYVVPPNINYATAANSITNGMLQHLKNIGITNKPGPNYHLVYQNPANGRVDITDPTQYPSVNDPLPPSTNGFTDYLFFYTNTGNTGYHLNLNTTEYNYYNTEFYNYVAAYPYTVGYNHIIYASLTPVNVQAPPNVIYKHDVLFFYSLRRWVLNPPSTL